MKEYMSSRVPNINYIVAFGNLSLSLYNASQKSLPSSYLLEGCNCNSEV